MLVAISIPIFSARLESSRESVDVSNMRSAYAIASADLLSSKYKDTTVYNQIGTSSVYYAYYDTKKGEIVKDAPHTYGKAKDSGIDGNTPDWNALGAALTESATSVDTSGFYYSGGDVTNKDILVVIDTGNETVGVSLG